MDKQPNVVHRQHDKYDYYICRRFGKAAGAYLGLDNVVLVAEPPGWPYITASPTNLTNSAGTEAAFTASAGGNPSTVQWYLGVNAVPGATNTTLTFIANATNAGIYTAVFSNSLGTNVTAPAVLTVLQVTSSPASQSVNAGAAVQLSAAANLSNAIITMVFRRQSDSRRHVSNSAPHRRQPNRRNLYRAIQLRHGNGNERRGPPHRLQHSVYQWQFREHQRLVHFAGE